MSERKKIVWLVSWYPNKYDRYDGDFIQRHARAAALYDDIHVLFVKLSEEETQIEREWNAGNGLSEQILYIPKQKGFRGKGKNFLRWKEIYRVHVAQIIQRYKPDLAHVHVPWKAGLVALWIKRKYKIPFIVTEHWGIYNNVAEDNIHTKPFLFRYLLRRIYKKASAFLSVSNYLGEGVKNTLLKKDYLVIPNVVDTKLFYPSTEKYSRFTFLHVSNMVPLKNVEGILESFRQFLQQTGADAQLILVGNRDGDYLRLAEQWNLLNTSIFFKGEVSYADVANEMQRSHVFVLNSNIENAPCVIGEALCCGLPVIATNVGGIPELVNSQNGVLVSPQNNTAFASAMVQIFQHYEQYSSAQISADASKKFSMNTIGLQFHQFYQRTGI